MSDLCQLKISYRLRVGGSLTEPIELDLRVCPESVTVQSAGAGLLRVDVKQYDGNHLAWIALAEPDFKIEVT